VYVVAGVCVCVCVCVCMNYEVCMVVGVQLARNPVITFLPPS